jgi:hypothetical protein
VASDQWAVIGATLTKKALPLTCPLITDRCPLFLSSPQAEYRLHRLYTGERPLPLAVAAIAAQAWKLQCKKG